MQNEIGIKDRIAKAIEIIEPVGNQIGISHDEIYCMLYKLLTAKEKEALRAETNAK